MLLNWLPHNPEWNELLASLKVLHGRERTACFRKLADSRMDFAQAHKLDRAYTRAVKAHGALDGLQPLRLAVLGSATISHLIPGIRLAGLRRGLALEIYEAPYGLYSQELMDRSSGLHRFRPEALLLALDAKHLAAARNTTPETSLDRMKTCWSKARESFSCQVIQQAVMPILPRLLGNNEARMPASPADIIGRVNALLRPACEQDGVDLLALDEFVATQGLDQWHDSRLWFQSKMEVHPRMAQVYGDEVVRVMAAARGQSSKCLVLDLDNTIWGGTLGDDGLEGIVLGQGSAAGEAFLDFQHYAKGLSERGVVLAVCSKNDEQNAIAPFEKHPEMVLRRGDIACFVANWQDKACNLKQIARVLNIALDSLVFVDDNPAERALVRRELPMVRVPELPDDPAEFASTLAATGYFEGVGVTIEDQERTRQYKGNAERTRSMDSATDMESYLQTLDMQMVAQPFDLVSLPRVVQLIHKTNQFNLTTERMNQIEVIERMHDHKVITLQFRLIDRFGDNGIVAAIIARVCGTSVMIETWLMSCRVLGRRVEEACLNVLVDACIQRECTHLSGQYRPTEKNGLVREMYGRLGFCKVQESVDGATRWSLDVTCFTPALVPIAVKGPPQTSA